jgi:hypothetical protein
LPVNERLYALVQQIPSEEYFANASFTESLYTLNLLTEFVTTREVTDDTAASKQWWQQLLQHPVLNYLHSLIFQLCGTGVNKQDLQPQKPLEAIMTSVNKIKQLLMLLKLSHHFCQAAEQEKLSQ